MKILQIIRNSIMALAVALGLLSPLLIHTPQANAAGKIAVYIVPHQDDETISMGADIVAHVAAGRPVKLVMVHDGTASAARGAICQKTGHCLTVQEFGAARDREFIAAAAKLGVPASNITFERLPEAQSTSAQAEAVIDKYIALYPGASFKTMSWLDLHPDHARLGYAMNNRCVFGQITDCRFLQSPLYQHGSTIKRNPVVTPKSGKYTNKPLVQAAANEYKYWNPQQGRYAVGYYSVRQQIDYVYNSHYSLYHMNNSNWWSTTDRNTAKSWIQTYQSPLMQ